jgi:hypothetical protein
MIQRVTRHSRLLLGANIVLAGLLLVGVTQIFLGGWQSRSSGNPVSALTAQQAQFAARLLKSELERVLQETREAAELATHIFSNPESYRLAAQPGEYDYDQATGLYGSARNDGSSVVFLSAASVLNPEILREIRLSEYLNPVFKASASLNPLGRSIVLYTTDGLIRAYPWFDFKSRIASGALKSGFSVTELPFFAKAMPSRNRLKEAVWQVFRSGSQSGEIQLVCAAPFFADETFRGVIAVEVDAAKLAAQLFTNLEPRDTVGLLMAVDGWVLGARPTPGAKVEVGGSLPDVLKNLKIFGLAGLEPLLRRLANTERFIGYQDGFYLAGATAAGDLPVRPVLVVPESLIRQQDAARESSGIPGWLLIAAGLACGLFLVDAWWIVQTRRNLVETEKKLGESFTALSDLNLQSALIVNPQGMLSELYPSLNEGLLSIQESLESSPVEVAPEEVAAVTEKVGRDLKLIEHQAAVFRAFDAADSAQHNLNRLAAALRGALDARLVSFFSYIESALRILPQEVSGATEEPTIAWKEGSLFNALNGSQRAVSSNTLVLSTEELQQLSPVIQGDYLAMPLLHDQRLLGAVVVSGKPSGISVEDEELLGALQVVLSRTVQNIYQCDGLSKLNQLRREYCFELAKAVEAPLDRIRTEVQSVYNRLGKLTPYYKQHCETILFEVGKLYEMLREARETDAVVQSESAEHALSSEVALAAIEKKERG